VENPEGMKKTSPVIVALDTPSRDRALDLVRALRAEISLFKVGLELYTAAGPAIIKELRGLGAEVFLDLKFHDIPNTVARAVGEGARLGVALMDLHLSGGPAMIRRAVDEMGAACDLHRLRRPALLGITLLTSLGASDLAALGISRSPEEQVLALAEMGRQAGLDGVVASARELPALRRHFGPEWLLVTPGIRPPGFPSDDQVRTLSPREAMEAGANFLVIGRPVTGAPDPAAAVREILDTLQP
jgi:orotidine-5'-phosphate decarboxylase